MKINFHNLFACDIIPRRLPSVIVQSFVLWLLSLPIAWFKCLDMEILQCLVIPTNNSYEKLFAPWIYSFMHCVCFWGKENSLGRESCGISHCIVVVIVAFELIYNRVWIDDIHLYFQRIRDLLKRECCAFRFHLEKNSFELLTIQFNFFLFFIVFLLISVV